MFCTHCGQQMPDQATYCSACGAGIRTSAPGAYVPKRLFRSRTDKKIAGICAGVARHIDADVTLIRILTVAAVCITGFIPGLIAYLVIWAIMPLEDPVVYRESQPVTAP